MDSIEEQTHQLFSHLVFSSRKLSPVKFEDNQFPAAHGLYRINGQKPSFDLRSSTSLLGHGHPLIYKARLTAALSPYRQVQPEKVVQLEDRISEFISQLTGIKVFATLSCDGLISHKQYISSHTLMLGRSKNFIQKEDLNKLQNSEILISHNLFAGGLFLSSRDLKISTKNYSTTHYYENNAVFRLLSLGGFYGKKGHIERRSNELKDFFSENIKIKKIEGLNLYLDKNCHLDSNIISYEGDILSLPLYYEQEHLNEFKKAFDKLCS